MITNHLAREMRDLMKNPKLLLQYLILNFFLLAVGLAAVVYIRKEAVIDYQKGQAIIIQGATGNLKDRRLPPEDSKDLKVINKASENIANPKAAQ